MQIVIIGTGNTATVLGRKLHAAGHGIVEVFGRNPQAAASLAAALNARPCSEWASVTTSADLYIIAIADKALAAKEIHLQLKDQLVVHTAGAVSIAVLKNISTAYGVLYPYQTLRKEIETLPEIPLLVDANNDTARNTLFQLAKTISEKVSFANDEERMKYHLCAVICNNFSNYLYVLTEDYCKRNGLLFSNLLPLIDETARRLHHFSPRVVQTGPAIRKDNMSIERHQQLLNDDPALQHLYRLFSEEILKYPW